MWNLCKADAVRQKGSGDSHRTEGLGYDFPHQGNSRKALRARGLPKISTSPHRLRLLLVL